MSEQELNTDDVAAMRREGDFAKFLRQANGQGRDRFRAGLRKPRPVLRTGTPHLTGAWPVGPSDDDAPARAVCICPDCTALQVDRPPLEDLLRTDDENERPESA